MRTRLSKAVCGSFLCGLLTVFPIGLRAEEPANKIPVTVKADKLDYDRANDVYVAEGNVRIEQEGMRVQADKIVLNNRTGEALAEGGVYIQEMGDIIRADEIRININTKAGLIYNGELFLSKDNLHVTGEKIERKSETVYHVEDGTFTTCDEGEWYLKADEIDVDMDRYAVGRGVSFNMIGLPVFYTPYLLFPVRRQSGLLIPEAGYSSSQGFMLKNAIFWAISDYQDMTFYSDYRSRNGHGTALEYRYVNSRDSAGKFYYNYFNTFNEFRSAGKPDGRWLLLYEHGEEIAEDLSVRSDLNIVSDFAYFRDLEKKLEFRSLPYLDSNLFYVERWNTASLYVLGQYAIDLTQPDNDDTIQKLPELRYNIFEEKLAGPLYLNFEATAANFSRQSGDDVMRADFNARMSSVLGRGGVTLTPYAGFRATFYDRSGVNADSTEPVERKYTFAGATLNARLSRTYGSDTDAGFGQIRHSIEPTITYDYVPDVPQLNLPLLDAVETAGRQNFLSLALINRLTAGYKDDSGFRTFDVLVFRLSESYDLDKARSNDPAISEQSRSEIRSELFIKTPKLLTLSVSETYDTYEDVISSASENISVAMETVRFHLSHQYLREPKTRFLIVGAGKKFGKWDIEGQLWRDIEQKETTQQEYKLHYTSQCWGLGIMYITKPGETQSLLTLELKGLGALKGGS